MKFEELCDSINRQVKDKRVVVIVGKAGTGIETIGSTLLKDYLMENGGFVKLYHQHYGDILYCYHEKVTVDDKKAVLYNGVVINDNYTTVRDEMGVYTSSDKVIITKQLPVHGKVGISILDYFSRIFKTFTVLNIDRFESEFKYEEMGVVLDNNLF